MLHKIKRNANYAFMEHDYLALLAIGSGPSKQILTETQALFQTGAFQTFLS